MGETARNSKVHGPSLPSSLFSRLTAKFAYSCALAVLSLLVVALGWKDQYLVFALLLAIGAGFIYVGKSRNETILFALYGLWGASAEAIAIWLGGWNYSNPLFFGIPLWLPILWGIAACFVLRVKEQLDALLET
ncbi:hypothetical protein FJZ26_02845 [Candidatus Parvarchaeota archaeon]|nr:hypothetical protein [Candidatus Parvarchaeota archaeon]